MKKFIALLLVMTMVFSMGSPVFALSENGGSIADLQETTIDFDNKSVAVRYRTDDENRVTYAEIGKNIVEVDGEQVFWNGELVATITREVVYENSEGVEPRTSWIYTDTCPYGSFSDYTTKWKTVNTNITFEKILAQTSVEVILATLITLVDFTRVATGRSVFEGAALEIKEGMEEYEAATKLYSKEVIYSHKTVPSAFHQNNFYFYADSAHEDYLSYALAYSSWA